MQLKEQERKAKLFRNAMYAVGMHIDPQASQITIDINTFLHEVVKLVQQFPKLLEDTKGMDLNKLYVMEDYRAKPHVMRVWGMLNYIITNKAGTRYSDSLLVEWLLGVTNSTECQWTLFLKNEFKEIIKRPIGDDEAEKEQKAYIKKLAAMWEDAYSKHLREHFRRLEKTSLSLRQQQHIKEMRTYP